MNPMLAAFLETWRRPGLLLMVLGASILWLVAFFLWLGIPIATGSQIFLQAVAALALLALPYFVALRVFRTVGGTRFQFSANLLAALILGGLAGVAAPYLLIWWIPKVQSLAGQSASAAIRFLVAGLLFSCSFIWVIRLAAEPHGKDVPPEER